jgi:hypothetical protein
MNNGYITNGTTQDGFGSRMHRVIQTIAFVYYLRENYNINLEYIHTPFQFEGFGVDFSTGADTRGSFYINKYGDPYDEINREGYLNRAKLWDSKLSYNGTKITDINIDNFEIIDSLDVDKSKLYQCEIKNWSASAVGGKRLKSDASDEEIMKAANEYADVYQCPSEVKMCKHDVISAWNNAIKWYREQLKQRQ